MPAWLKALLVVAAVFSFLVMGVIAAGALWWRRNKDTLVAGIQKVGDEAKEFGRQSDNQGCLDEGLARYKKDPGMSTALSASLFLRVCLDESRPTPGFCESVPKMTEFVKSAEWRVGQCRDRGLAGDNFCQNLFQSVQQHCEKGNRPPTTSTSP